MVEGQEQRALPAVLTTHWGWLLVAQIIQAVILVIFKFDLWYVLGVVELWAFVQAYLLLKLNSRSTAVYWYLACLILWLAASAPYSPSKNLSFVHPLLSVVAFAVGIAGVFIFCWDVEWYFNEFNEIDGRRQRLSLWMALLFTTLYFQYKFREFEKRRPMVAGGYLKRAYPGG